MKSNTGESALCSCVLMLFMACSSSTVESAATSATAVGDRVVFLGTGTPNALPDRSGPGVAIVAGDAAYLVDAGPGIVRRAAAAAQNGTPQLDPANLRIAFITHLHSDHTIGLPDLIFTPWSGADREEPLELYGPPGIGNMAEHILAAYDEDIRIRIDGPQPATPEGYRVNWHEVSPGEIYSDSNVTVTAFRVNHDSWRHAYGYKFETANRTIVVSGDASPSASIAENCVRCDVLVHEVYSATALEGRAPDWQRYHRGAHTSTHELGVIAAEAQPGVLVLYHQLFWGTTPADLLREIGEVYDGRVVSANDLDVF
ncbi:MAG: MBL fold metallo-hydrolase [Gemmatimonadetes bacterium]|nr:MBL fold metallo-hydrolase [Gemmatimonadota bacterium]